MPGAKRKYDEDTWIVTQSKKFKCGQLISNVYASTLAQLRLGARNFFNTTSPGGNSGNPSSPRQNQGNNSANVTPGSPQPPSSPFNSPPASPLIRDLIGDNDMFPIPTLGINRPLDICQNCSNKTEFEKCYYCEKIVCHVNACDGCQDGFCGGCCITKYDNPSGDTYSCYACLC